ncbi:MAG: hypothetical protein AB7S99_08865 [Pseudodonghicola sp.]
MTAGRILQYGAAAAAAALFARMGHAYATDLMPAVRPLVLPDMRLRAYDIAYLQDIAGALGAQRLSEYTGFLLGADRGFMVTLTLFFLIAALRATGPVWLRAAAGAAGLGYLFCDWSENQQLYTLLSATRPDQAIVAQAHVFTSAKFGLLLGAAGLVSAAWMKWRTT